MPTILEIFGFRFFFYSNEHPAIHVHAEKSDGEAKIELEPFVRVVKNNGLKRQELRKAVRLAKMFKSDFIAEWHKIFG